VRAIAYALRQQAEFERASPVPRRFADEMTHVLAERDRQMADIQREADDRLALLETVNAEAAERLAVMEEMEREIARLAAEIDLIRRDQAEMAAQNMALQLAAEDRLALLRSNDAAYHEFKTIMRGRLAELMDMLG
jgi:hypothetical protein